MPGTAPLRRQLRLLRAFAALTYPFACVPFLWFWFTDQGVTSAECGALISLYYVTMVVAEIPTGLCADRFGARRALIVGPLVLGAGFVAIARGDGFADFCVGEVLFGLGHSILSGPPSALLFDSLRAADRSDDFHRQEAIANTFRLLGTGVSFLLGGIVVAAAGIPPAIVLTAGLCVAASAVAWFVRDVPHRPTEPGAEQVSLLRGALRDLRDPSVRWILAYYVVLFCLLRFPFHTYQPFLREANTEAPLVIGLLFFALNLFAAPFSRLTPWLCRAVGTRALLWSMPTAIALSLVAMAAAQNVAGVALFFLHQIPFGMHWAVVQDHANHRIRGRARATVLSVMSFAGRIVFAGLFPLVMALDDLALSYLAFGCGGTLATVAVMATGRRAARATSAPEK